LELTLSIKLFCYGTLQIPEVIKVVTGKTHKGVKAKLPGYAMYRARNKEYPGVVRSSNSETVGVLYTDIGENELGELDLFEGDLFERKLLNIIQRDKKKCDAWVYVVPDQNKDKLTKDPWNLKDFLKNDINNFMKNIEGEQ
jgi:gamma-glutamylcyclotransferase (GGCT)/AIG2-like uncharacterized protein YtfP